MEEDDKKQIISIASGGAISLIGTLIGKVLNFIIFVFIARMLSAFDFGLFAIGKSIFNLGQNVATFGLNKSVIKFGTYYNDSSNKHTLNRVFYFIISVALIISVLLSLILFLCAKIISLHFFNELNLKESYSYFLYKFPFTSY